VLLFLLLIVSSNTVPCWNQIDISGKRQILLQNLCQSANFSSLGITDEDLQNFFSQAFLLPPTKSISLDNNFLTDKSVPLLVSLAAKIPGLKNMRLNDNVITKVGYLNLIETLRNLRGPGIVIQGGYIRFGVVDYNL